MLKLQYLGSEILRKKCKEVSFGENMKNLSQEMLKITEEYEGCGLAAPQVNIDKRMFVVDLSFLKNRIKNLPFETEVVVNPKIKLISEIHDLKEEACLSIPEIYIKVLRPVNIEVEYWNVDWEKRNLKLEGIPARVFCHEYDHLDGILIIDRASKKEKKRIEDKISKLF